MFNKRNLIISVIIAMIMGLTLTSVSAQATQQQTSVYTYGGNPLVTLLGNGVVFAPGDTTVTPVLLESGAAFNVMSYRNEAELAAGTVLGQASATCGQTLVGNTCSISVSGTNPDIRLMVLPSTTTLVEIKYGGTSLARFLGGMFVFQPGDTTGAAKILSSNTSFVAVNYRNQTDLVNGTVMGSGTATCNTLMATSCELSVANTTNQMWIKIQPATMMPVTATTTPVAAVSTPVVAATPNPLLGQGGANPGAVTMNTLTPVRGQWVFATMPGSTNASAASWQQMLGQLGVRPELWPTAPNVPNPLVPAFPVRNGTEVPNGMAIDTGAIHDVCQTVNFRCNLSNQARHIFYFSGGFNVPVFGTSCEATPEKGCMLVLVNSGNEDYMMIDQEFRGGYAFDGEYFNGAPDALGMTLHGMISNGVGNIMNMNTSLNTSSSTNTRGNCDFNGCGDGVEIHVVGHSSGVKEWEGVFLYHP